MVLQSFLYNMFQFFQINQDLGKDVSGAASKDAPNIDVVANMGLVHVSFVFLSTHVSYILKMCILLIFLVFLTIISVCFTEVRW